MTRFSKCLVIPLLLIIISCGSKVPIADISQAVVDDRLLGKWMPAEQDENEYFEFSLFKFNDKEYLSWIHSEEKDTSETKIKNKFYRIYFIDILDKHFINAQDINSFKKADRLYFFYRYEMQTDSTMMLVSLKDIDSVKVDKFEKSEDLYNFVKKNIHNKKLYGDSTALIKIY